MLKLSLSLLLVSLLAKTSFAQEQQQMTQKDFDSLHWILGQWERTNTRSGTSATESWRKVSNNRYEGIGVNTRGSDTTFVEHLRLEFKDQKIVYVADVRENATPIYFRIDEITKNGFISKNPDHDFPKVISYQLNANKMSAIISDGKDKKMAFEFVKRR
ncbi:DUF6265 family protein [Roseivirga misakiensis]|uniref:DUF6265 domain-containing protein n=1 Tax=Roseivirga misakiensis TaxID=1563681 RepID=A0A1E5T031_9BACT|nr:DUF6265 family protein [Roseivirga misakiensis]OEK04730.1 hypothetical protein BFP71_14885 [Roseivirga misakiensis]